MLKISDYLIPGDDGVTARAMEAFASDMKSGVPIQDAMEAFCKEIVNNG